MADSRNPSGRRPPILPLPAPPPDMDDPPRPMRSQRVYETRTEPGHTPRAARGPNRPVSADATSELPRLPEVEIHDESSEIDARMDHRALAPNRADLSGARSLPVPPQDTTRSFKPTAQQKMRPQHQPQSQPLPYQPPMAPQPMPAPAAPQAQQPRPPIEPTHHPRPPARSAAVRVHTAVHSSLIGGRYQIQQRIGQGGMGKVYKVTHTHLSRTFALKIISSQVAETDEARELFYREARFASAMAHPNITSVVDFGEDEKVGMFMVMEYVDGESLNKVLFRDKRMDVKKACEIVLQVAEALHYIHKQNVVHCDIKTENILIGEEELDGKRRRMFVKLLDFGLARSLTASRASTSLSGTPHYVAPERIRGEPASPSSDVYGVGILLYELILRPGAVGRPGAEDPRRPPRRAAGPADARGRGPRPRRREPRAARAREAPRRTPQGYGGVHLRAAHRDGHARVRPQPQGRPRQARRDREGRGQQARRARAHRVRRVPASRSRC